MKTGDYWWIQRRCKVRPGTTFNFYFQVSFWKHLPKNMSPSVSEMLDPSLWIQEATLPGWMSFRSTAPVPDPVRCFNLLHYLTLLQHNQINCQFLATNYRNQRIRNVATLQASVIQKESFYWWLVESHLSGCFCFFVPKVWKGGGDLQMIFCQSMSSVWVVRWWGHSNLNCCNWICLINVLHLGVVLKHCSRTLMPQWTT